METRISGIKDPTEEMDTSGKENFKSKNNPSIQHPGKLNTIKIPNLTLIGTEKGEKNLGQRHQK